jgi:hypothetical protein
MKQTNNSAEIPVREDSLEYALSNRAEILAAWLRENAPNCADEQAHLDEGSDARVYWTYGYLVALHDALEILASRRTRLN